MDEEIEKINEDNLRNFRKSGVVKTLKIYTGKDEYVCKVCIGHRGNIINMKDAVIGVNIPQFKDCESERCRCFWSPEEISF